MPSGQRYVQRIAHRIVGIMKYDTGIYLLAFGRLRSVFTTHELSALADTMAERGLRLHQELDEILEDMDAVEARTRHDIDDMSGDDEIEHNAKELKRLKPYCLLPKKDYVSQ